ncbi:MAG: HAD hydrolase-like protein, partial [Microbacteriaceae bacterium]|nr:HAD hydrolase-like protein [Burkholderiaceae bacterium]
TAGKPNPLMLQQLMSVFGAVPARTLMIGDTSLDLQLAINAGTASVAVSYGAHQPDAFPRLAALHVGHSTIDLHDWLLAHG